MGVLNNVNQGDIPEILRRLRALENRTTLNHSAIGRGGMEVYDGGVLNISNGGLNVVGSGTFTGTLYADGTIAFTGTFTQSGPSTFTGDTSLNGPTHVNGNTDITGDLTVTGPTHLNGPTDINGNLDVDGTLDINGAATLNNDLTVQGGGKIKAGNVTIDPSASGGAIRFTSGRVLRDTGSSMVLDNGAGSATVSVTSSHVLLEAGTAQVDVVGNVVGIVGDLEATGDVYMNLPTTSQPANVRIDPTSGQLFRSTA